MKKILFLALYSLAVFVTSCSNEEILIVKDNSVNEVNVNVSLANFMSGYNFNDTYHDISVTEDFRTFFSEHEKYIHVRTLFYNSNGNLVDSIVTYSSTTNAVSKSIKLAEGTYTVVTTLNFSDDQSVDGSWWDLYNKEKISTAYLSPYRRNSIWCIMSYAAQTITVSPGNNTNISMNPSPIGAIGYMYLQNFQYKNEATYGTIADNGVRTIALYSQQVADGYKLDPNASEKYIYLEATGSGSWYYLSSNLEPSDFSMSKDYGYFRTNLYSYLYILAPSFRGCFGYELEGETSFNKYGDSTYSISNGQTYLAYWDWFQVGNPYFGIADNNHWNKYDSDARYFDAINLLYDNPKSINKVLKK